MKSENRFGLDGYLSGYLTKKRKKKAMPYFFAAEKILDIGCGVFIWNNEISKKQNYLGLDIDEDIIDYNKTNYQSENKKFKKFDFHQDSIESLDKNYDTVIMLAIIEHFVNPNKVMSKIVELVKPGGKIIITTPAPYGEIILDIGSKFGIFAKDKHEHQELFNYGRVLELSKNNSLDLILYKKFLFFQNQLVIFKK